MHHKRLMMDGFPLACVHPPVLQSIFGSTPIGSVHDQGIYVELSLGILTGVTERWRPVKDCQADDFPARDMRALREKPKN
jgi:hypothetical protein